MKRRWRRGRWRGATLAARAVRAVEVVPLAGDGCRALRGTVSAQVEPANALPATRRRNHVQNSHLHVCMIVPTRVKFNLKKSH